MSLVGKELAFALAATALKAGAVILEHYSPDIAVSYKQDGSPVTAADQEAEALILEDLRRLAPGIPVIAEEATAKGQLGDAAPRFFLVDPLDGTKEFIKRNGEFTVNIALVDDGIPCAGVIYAPVSGELYFTLSPAEAVSAVIPATAGASALDHAKLKPMHVRPWDAANLTAAVSRSHNNEETEQFLRKLGVAHTVSAGSSLKFCLIASGRADVYPRFGRTCEWDTAAGDAILRASGGCLLTTSGDVFVYGKREANYVNPDYVAWGHVAGEWQEP